jgi:uncharacterized protein involved in exopolysaccharide biosynthesis
MSNNILKVEPEEISFSKIIILIRLKSKFVILILFVSILLTIGYSYIAPHQYESMGSILPPEDSGGGGGLTSFLQSISGGFSIEGAGQSSKILVFQDMLKSREVAKNITQSLGLDKKPDVKPNQLENLYSSVSKMLKIELKRSGIINISSFTSTGYFPDTKDKDEAAELSAKLINTAIKALDEVNREKNLSKSKRKREFLERILTERKIALDSVDKHLEQFRTEHKIFSIDDQSEAILGNAVTLGTELAKSEVDLNLKLLEYEPNSAIVQSAKRKLDNVKEQYGRVQTGGIGSGDLYSIPLNQVPSLVRQYTTLMRKQKILEQVNLYLETQRYQELIQEKRDLTTVEQLDIAQVPTNRSAPNRKMMILLDFVIVSILLLFYIIIDALRKGYIYIRKDVEDQSVTEKST